MKQVINNISLESLDQGKVTQRTCMHQSPEEDVKESIEMNKVFSDRSRIKKIISMRIEDI